MAVSTLATTNSYLGGGGFLLGVGSNSVAPPPVHISNARVTQVAVEALGLASSNARVTQVAAEILATGNSNARVTQIAIEVLGPNVGTAYVTQAGVEVAYIASANAIATQAGVEVMYIASANVHVTQAGIEVVTPARIRAIIAHAAVGRSFSRVITTLGKFLVTKTRTINTRTSFSQIQSHAILASGRFKKTTTRTISGHGAFGSVTHTRTITTHASLFSARTRTILAHARIGSIDRTIPTRGIFFQETARVIFANCSIGYRRTVPARASLLGKPGRTIPSWAHFRTIGIIPTRASFWFNTPTWSIHSDAQGKVMDAASRLIGGSVGSYLGLVPSTNGGALSPNWQLPTYDDSFWPKPAITVNDLIPFPFPDSSISMLSFNWSWPNDTNDDARGGWLIAPSPSVPCFGTDFYRRSFGLPLDPAIVAATSGILTVGAEAGVLIAQINSATLNGHNLPLISRPLTNPSAVENVYEVPSSVLLPGNNTIALSYFTYLSFGVFGRRLAFTLVFKYQPKGFGLPQITG